VVSNLHLLSFGEYKEDQLVALKARNPELIGHMRHYDEIRSHGANRHCVRGYIADRPFERAIKDVYYQTIDGSPWGIKGDLNVINLGLRMSGTKTDFPLGAAPPGYHLPQWEAARNPDFVPL
jgi:hypothetical protein